MNITADIKTMDEIFVDDIPIGFVILDENKHIERAEIYNDNIHTLYDAKMLKKFVDRIIKCYFWVDSE